MDRREFVLRGVGVVAAAGVAGGLVACGGDGGGTGVDGGGGGGGGNGGTGGGGGGNGDPEPDVTVEANGDLRFDPAEVTIQEGQTVRWEYTGGPPHTVTPDGHNEWQSASLEDFGDVFDHTFDQAGTYDYFCEPHRSNGMVGTIVVEAAM